MSIANCTRHHVSMHWCTHRIIVCVMLCSLFNWSVPFCSTLAVTILCMGAVLFYFIPPNYIVLVWGMFYYTKTSPIFMWFILGVNKFSKRLLRPNYIPNNELLDFISRLPSDEELVSLLTVNLFIWQSHSLQYS